MDSIQFPPDFSVPNVFSKLKNFMSLNLKLINTLSMAPFIDLLEPIYDWLVKRRCFWFFGEHCFSIKDIFDNWLIRFVSGIIDFFLSPLLEPMQLLFQGLSLPSLPSLSLSPRPNWAAPSFSINFDVGRLNLPCLEYDNTAKTVLSKCFDFPSLKIPTPFIFNPLSFACDEDCDTSCNTCLQRMSSCDSSCEFVASCASSGRRLEDSSDAITAEPKAVGWSERLAAAAAQEVK